MMKYTIASVAVAASLLISSAAAAHDHSVTTGNGRKVILANGFGSHVAPTLDENGRYQICGPKGFDPAWYGLEVAHHGPDASGSGPTDGCYMIEGGVDPRTHDGNPAIN
jgi:hypothetical protein